MRVKTVEQSFCSAIAILIELEVFYLYSFKIKVQNPSFQPLKLSLPIFFLTLAVL